MAAERGGRRLAQGVALALQAALPQQHAPAPVLDAFCRSRLGGDWGQAYGALPPTVDFDSLLTRAMPRRTLKPP